MKFYLGEILQKKLNKLILSLFIIPNLFCMNDEDKVVRIKGLDCQPGFLYGSNLLPCSKINLTYIQNNGSEKIICTKFLNCVQCRSSDVLSAESCRWDEKSSEKMFKKLKALYEKQKAEKKQ